MLLGALPVRKIPGIGRVTEKILREALGIQLVSEIVSKCENIVATFSEVLTPPLAPSSRDAQIGQRALFEAAVGFGRAHGGVFGTHAGDSERKSFSVERTFRDCSLEPQLVDTLMRVRCHCVRSSR